MAEQLGSTEKYVSADEKTRDKVDNILSTLIGVDVNKVDEIVRIVQSEVFAFNRKIKEGVTFSI